MNIIETITNKMPSKSQIIGTSVILLLVGLIGFFFWFVLWVTIVDNYELGYSFDRYSGKIEVIEKRGWIVRTPWRFKVHTIDLRPYQIIISANERVLNAKLCRFNPEGLQTFVEWHGRGAGQSSESLKEILKCYAFDVAGGKDCPFLEVVQEVAPNQGITIPESPVDMERIEK